MSQSEQTMPGAAGAQQITQWQTSPNLAPIALKGRMDEQLDRAESACRRLEEIVARAHETLAPYARMQEPALAKPDRPDRPALGAHASRISEVSNRVDNVSDSLVDLLDSLDV